MAEQTGPGGIGQGGSGEAVTAGGGQEGPGGQFLSHREVMIVLPGLLLAILLAMLDNLIVSTALPRIVGDLGGVAHLSWVVTAYILASLVVTPFYGKLGDMYGRKKFFIVAITDLPGRVGAVRPVAVDGRADHLPGHTGAGRRRADGRRDGHAGRHRGARASAAAT